VLTRTLAFHPLRQGFSDEPIPGWGVLELWLICSLLFAGNLLCAWAFFALLNSWPIALACVFAVLWLAFFLYSVLIHIMAFAFTYGWFQHQRALRKVNRMVREQGRKLPRKAK
jgi:hypothetical protein